MQWRNWDFLGFSPWFCTDLGFISQSLLQPRIPAAHSEFSPLIPSLGSPQAAGNSGGIPGTPIQNHPGVFSFNPSEFHPLEFPSKAGIPPTGKIFRIFTQMLETRILLLILKAAAAAWGKSLNPQSLNLWDFLRKSHFRGNILLPGIGGKLLQDYSMIPPRS